MKSPPSLSLSERLQKFLGEVQEGSSFTVNSLLEQADKESFGLILALLAIPGGLLSIYGCPFGLLIMGMSLPWLRKTPVVYIPDWARSRRLRKGLILHGLHIGVKILRFLEIFSRPRAHCMWSFFGKLFTSIAILGLGFLNSLPLPLTHTIPAIFLGLIGLSIAVRDGLWLALFTLGAWITLACYGYVGWLFIHYGVVGVKHFVEKVL